ncbi:GntR family transcriptional regulator [Streptomyces europaeiscabiei]|uniref:GntR family transcriptional regulator n=1 Tax=Streptomyces europaeiscabiei TaxID=146819 RepID=UPI002E1915FF
MSLDRPVSRRLLSDEVFHRLRDSIVRGELVPGEKVKDGELAERLGLSHTPHPGARGARPAHRHRPGRGQARRLHPCHHPQPLRRREDPSQSCVPSTGLPSGQPFRS